MNKFSGTKAKYNTALINQLNRCKSLSLSEVLTCCCINNFKTYAYTCFMTGLESFPLDWSIRVEYHEHHIRTGSFRLWHAASTESTETTCIDVITVKYFNVIIGALLVWFQFKMTKGESNTMSFCGSEMPHAVLPAGVVVRPIRTADLPRCITDRVLTSTLNILYVFKHWTMDYISLYVLLYLWWRWIYADFIGCNMFLLMISIYNIWYIHRVRSRYVWSNLVENWLNLVRIANLICVAYLLCNHDDSRVM